MHKSWQWQGSTINISVLINFQCRILFGSTGVTSQAVSDLPGVLNQTLAIAAW